MIIVEVHDYAAMDDPRWCARHLGGHVGVAGLHERGEPRLIGAVSFGLSFGASTIGGVTPAADLDSVLGHAAPAAAELPRAPRPPSSRG